VAPPRGEAVHVAALSELPLGEGRNLHVGRREVALFRTGPREVRAIAARCPHAGGPLADGIVAGGKVTCPLHGWKFDLATGEGTSPGGNCEGIPAFAVELRGEQVWLSLGSSARPASAADGEAQRANA
jgi:nitrite reductase (NADH) small subunit